VFEGNPARADIDSVVGPCDQRLEPSMNASSATLPTQFQLNQAEFIRLFETVADIDLFGSGPPAIPWGERVPSPEDVRVALEGAADALPLSYDQGYTAPFKSELARALQRAGGDTILIETLAGAVYDHAAGDIGPQLGRFLAVVSNLYRSFLSSKRRSAADFPLAEVMPPLAMFQSDGRNGPFTIPVDSVASLFGGTVGVVSLPSSYRDHPLLWASLAHETGGHDVIHADGGLLPELTDGVRSFFGGGQIGSSGRLSLAQFLGLLWSWWMDEAVSDVYGVMNIGPSFGLNLAVFFAALNERVDPTGHPRLRTQSGPDERGVLDPHPTDIVRLDLIRGAVESLHALSQATREAYTESLDELSQLLRADADSVEIQGLLPTGPGVGLRISVSLPLETMQSAARQVGAYIASAALTALGGHSIQDLETWDNTDEQSATEIAAALRQDRSVVAAGDDAQLLAAATIAGLQQAAAYPAITHRLEEALDASFASDPFWGLPMRDRAYIQTGIGRLQGEAELEVYVTVQT
jgi:hypothetical protein